MAVLAERQHGGNDGYNDVPVRTYRWDSTVPNHAGPRAGHPIAVWNKTMLLGASVIEEIRRGQAEKRLYRCPQCGRASIKARRELRPRYRCNDCHGVFAEPHSFTKPVETYESVHGRAWIDLRGHLPVAELRALCVHPKSQLSIRPLRWDDFAAVALPGSATVSPKTDVS
jgi:predicted RNA-binding Zn-ribbon protein involved in translation (DUF1610 family)